MRTVNFSMLIGFLVLAQIVALEWHSNDANINGESQCLSGFTAPVYPPLARQARVQGVVVVRVYLDTEGVPVRSEAVAGHPLLQQAALDVINQWRFCVTDARQGQTTVSLRFKLEGAPSDSWAPTLIQFRFPGEVQITTTPSSPTQH